MARVGLCLFLSVLLQLLFVSGVLGATFTISNNCEHTVWPGLLSGAGTAPLTTTGFPLQKGESRSVSAPTHWSGRIWGRTQCAEDSSGKFSCMTGDCGSGKVECAGAGGALPSTLAEFTLDGSGGLDFYDVSLVDGYNLPMVVVPQGGSGNCTTTGCVVELNGACPSELRVAAAAGESVACRSACEAFNAPEYCCSGAYATPDTCKPSAYSEFFKHACPRAYSYAYDDSTSTFTCASADYAITFCPNFSSKKSAAAAGGEGNGRPEAVQQPLVNGSMIFTGMEYASDAASRGGAYFSGLLAISAWALLA